MCTSGSIIMMIIMIADGIYSGRHQRMQKQTASSMYGS